MTEPKPQWEGLYAVGASSTNAPDYVAKFTGTMNGEPLTTEQLHELIVSQSMTIDRLLGEVGRYRAALEQMRKQYKKGHYIIQVTPEIANVLDEIS